MKNKFLLHIPNPCSENWDNFKPMFNGGFCSSCKTMVTDFTKMSDEQIADFFSHQSVHVCGRFRSDQLKEYSNKTIPVVRPSFKFFKAGALGLLVLLLSKPGLAQSTDAEKKPAASQHVTKNNSNKQIPDVTEHEVKGVIVSKDDKLPLPGVNVILIGTDIGTITNAEGQFKFPKKLKAGDVLTFSFIGFETEQYKVPNQNTDNVTIALNLYTRLLGAVAVQQIYEEPKSGIKKFWGKVKNVF